MKTLLTVLSCAIVMLVVTAIASLKWCKIMGEEVWWSNQNGKVKTQLYLFGITIHTEESIVGKGLFFAELGAHSEGNPALLVRRSLLQPRRTYGENAELYYAAKTFEIMVETGRLSETDRLLALRLINDKKLLELRRLMSKLSEN